jgi:hypothetical protein
MNDEYDIEDFYDESYDEDDVEDYDIEDFYDDSFDDEDDYGDMPADGYGMVPWVDY